MTEIDNFKLDCSKCGAQQSYSPGQRAIKCEFCGSETEIPRDEDMVAGVGDSDYIVPLTVDKKELESATMAYMADGDFTPDDILEKSIISKQWLHYVPTYMFHGNYDASWTATFGYDRTEHYTDYVTRFDNGRSWKEPVTKTKTVTDWRPVNGVDTGEFCVQTYAGDKLDERAVDLVENASLTNKITEFKSEYILGMTVERYVLREQDTYEQAAKSRINSIIDAGVRSHAQGDHQRDWHWTANIDKKSSAVLMPVAHSIFEYEGKEYNVWLDGSDPSKMVGDALPVDNGKRSAASRGFIPLYLGLAALGIALIYSIGLFFIPVAISILILGGYAYLRKHQMISHSKKIRSSLLLQKKAGSAGSDEMSEDERKKLISSYQIPRLPVTANPKNDKFILPIVSALGLLLILGPGLISSSNMESKASSEQEEQDTRTAEQAAMDASPAASYSSPQSEADPAITLLSQAESAYQAGNYSRSASILRRAKAMTSTDPAFGEAIQRMESMLSAAFIQNAERELKDGLHADSLASLNSAKEVGFVPHRDTIDQLNKNITESQYGSENQVEQYSSGPDRNSEISRMQAEAEASKARRDALLAERELLAERRRLAEQATQMTAKNQNQKSQIACEYSTEKPLACASRDRKPTSCSWNFESCGMPALLKQQSKTTCSGKMSANQAANQLIVTDGCRGLFVPDRER